MEGIAGILRTAQHCSKHLTKRKQFSLMVRLLTGIGRFREMFYVIETLYNQHHFEVLCRKGKGDVKVGLGFFFSICYICTYVIFIFRSLGEKLISIDRYYLSQILHCRITLKLLQ